MAFCNGGIRLASRLARQVELPFAEFPVFLCPALLRFPSQCTRQQRRKLHSASVHTTISHAELPQVRKTAKDLHLAATVAKLPIQCAGCGALTQTIDKDEPGFFNLKRRTVKDYLEGRTVGEGNKEEDAVIEESLKNAAQLNPKLVNDLQLDFSPTSPKTEETVETPMCERCHNIKHHETGLSIHHPSIHSIEDTILESPHKYNHIYHVIDAADFPMSLVSGLHKLLNITPLRSLNRRSKTGKFYHGKKTEISFIVTRSDLLAPKKEQVDSMMPYMRNVLRDALGRVATDVRLGNLRCVSAKRSWWTKELKEDIWKRGGGGWMVGKVNVGKSQLFQEVFPKGRREKGKLYGPPLPPPSMKDTEMKPIYLDEIEAVRVRMAEEFDEENGPAVKPEEDDDELSSELDYLETGSLLPPAPVEVDYPQMPLVSALPGTTASPIRVPFGNGKGELIDLPGLARGDLELHVQPEHRGSLVMRARVRPEQQSIRPGQSLLLGGFVRITPTTPDLVFLAYSFNPLTAHLTSTEKAIGTQTQTRESTVENIAVPGTGEKIKSAGTFHLRWDVTKQRTGPITARDAAAIHPDRLPYKVMAADILIEGCGWVELVAQIRKPRRETPPERPRVQSSRDRELASDNQNTASHELPLEKGSWGWGRKTTPPPEVKPPEEKPFSKQTTDETSESAEEEIDPLWPTVEVFTPEGRFAAVRQPMNAWLLCAVKPSEKKAASRPRRSMKGMKKLTKTRARAAASM